MTETEFIKEIEKLGININKNQLEQLEKYYELLVEWNEKMNLTGITEKSQVYLKHFYDSLTLAKVINLEEQETLCDVGSGAGFPGLVLKILFPNLKVTLVDSLQKRITFLETVIKELKLVNIEALHMRAEEYGRNEREKFDVVTARAVAPLNILSEYCLPLVKCGKYFIAMKGDIAREIKDFTAIEKELMCSISKPLEFKLPYENSTRTLIKIEKKNLTPKKYPRKFSEIKKKPISTHEKAQK